jgi:anti-sigma B factor antagonist
MEISTTQYKRCDLVKACGRIDSATAPQLQDEFNRIMNENRYRIVFNMECVDFISSAGLRVLIFTQKTCKRYNRGELVLTNLPENIDAALDLAGFKTLFNIYQSELDAIGNI